MKVKELIAELQKLDGDLDVTVATEEGYAHGIRDHDDVVTEVVYENPLDHKRKENGTKFAVIAGLGDLVAYSGS